MSRNIGWLGAGLGAQGAGRAQAGAGHAAGCVGRGAGLRRRGRTGWPAWSAQAGGRRRMQAGA